MTESISLDALYDLTRITEVALAPDGKRVAFVASEASRADDERRSSLFVAPADGSRSPHRLTRASDAGSPKWSPDDSQLGFLASREEDVALAVEDSDSEDDEDADTENGMDESDDGNGSEDDEPKSQLWVFDLELSGDARQVTDREEGVREFDSNGVRMESVSHSL